MRTACYLVLVFCCLSCSTTRNLSGDDQEIEVNFLLINDVYEIAPLAGGKEGGVARVASLKKQYLQKNRNTFLVLAGDFLSPSVYNSLQYNGKAIRGKQMIESLNAAGLDLATFGNHEFDIRESELLERINESKFGWTSANTFHRSNDSILPFKKNGVSIPSTTVLNVTDDDGTHAKIGMFSVTLPFNKADYVTYTDAITTAKEVYNQLKDSVDAVVALTHQAIEKDKELAGQIPGIAIILGGHEHDMRFEKVGDVVVAKAHANAKSVYAVKININKKKKKVKADPKLVYIDETLPLDSATNAVVEKWTNIAEKNYNSLGFDAKKILLTNGVPLDGREAVIRSQQTELTKLIVKGIQFAAPQADVALMNSGSIRVDDVLQMPVTEYDILRTLPFGGSILEAEMKGSLLIKTLDQGEKNRGNGGFLQYNENLVHKDGIWNLNGQPLEKDKVYRVAISEFLFTGKEANLDFLNPGNPAIIKVYEQAKSQDDARFDIRLGVIRYLESVLKP